MDQRDFHLQTQMQIFIDGFNNFLNTQRQTIQDCNELQKMIDKFVADITSYNPHITKQFNKVLSKPYALKIKKYDNIDDCMKQNGDINTIAVSLQGCEHVATMNNLMDYVNFHNN